MPCLYNDTLFKTLKFKLYEESVKISTYNSSYDSEVAFLMPENAMIGALENNSTLGVILHLNSCPEFYFYLQPKWKHMTDIIPADSIFHVIIYMDKTGHIRISFFDLLLFFGISQYDFTMLERQSKLYTYLSTYHQNHIHTYHWVGYAKTCYECLNQNLSQNTLPFKVKHIVLMKCDSNVVQRVIPPIKIPQLTPIRQFKQR